MEPMDLKDLTFSKKEDFVTREIAGETIIVPIRKQAGDLESIYTLNELGTTIWGMIDGKTRSARSLKPSTKTIIRRGKMLPET
jgi:hypothetical protein